jgi:hypothetical protein
MSRIGVLVDRCARPSRERRRSPRVSPAGLFVLKGFLACT